jgi:RecA/RadA recombinase
VLFTEIVCQSGPENEPFLALLDRLRHGKCTDADFQTLNSRLLSNLEIDWTAEPSNGALVIVNQNQMKDELDFKAARFAKATGQKLHWYYTSDNIGRVTAEENVLMQQLMFLDSGKMNQRLGRNK